MLTSESRIIRPDRNNDNGNPPANFKRWVFEGGEIGPEAWDLSQATLWPLPPTFAAGQNWNERSQNVLPHLTGIISRFASVADLEAIPEDLFGDFRLAAWKSLAYDQDGYLIVPRRECRQERKNLPLRIVWWNVGAGFTLDFRGLLLPTPYAVV